MRKFDESSTLFHVHIPKTGGTTLNEVMSDTTKYINGGHSFLRDDIKVLGKVKIGFPSKDGKYFPTIWDRGFNDQLLIVVVVRNPFDWLASYYFHKGGSRLKFNYHRGWQGARDFHRFKNFHEFIMAYCAEDFAWHCPPLKTSLLGQIYDCQTCDYRYDMLLYTESLNKSIPFIRSKMRLSRKIVKNFNESPMDMDYRSVYSDKLIEAMNNKFSRFLQWTGYSFESGAKEEISLRNLEL